MQDKNPIWWRKGRGWTATINGKKKLLHATDYEEAMKVYLRLKAQADAGILLHCNPLRTIFEMYLDYTKISHPPSYKNHQIYLGSFLKHHPSLRVADLRAHHVQQWITAHPTWGNTTQSLAIATIMAAMNWAAKPENRLIEINPIRGMKRPQINSRGADVLISETDFNTIHAAARHQSFKDVLMALRQTAARPGTIVNLTAQQCDFEHDTIIVKEHKTAHRTGRALAIPMTAIMKELCLRNAKLHPTGPLLRTQKGRQWDIANLNGRLKNLCRKCGVKGRVIPYSFRHSGATDMLEAGVDPMSVAKILGHTKMDMIFKHYSHVGNPFLKSQLEKINQSSSGK